MGSRGGIPARIKGVLTGRFYRRGPQREVFLRKACKIACFFRGVWYNRSVEYGDIAQLVERCVRNAEVSSSSLVISTTSQRDAVGEPLPKRQRLRFERRLLLFPKKICRANLFRECQGKKCIRGYSSVGRALEWHSRGQGFDSP